MIAEAFDYKLKIVIIGDSMVGKSCVILRYTENTFNYNHLATVGVDFHIKDLIFNDKKIKLQLWDTAGQERFHAISTSYCRGSDGVIFAYDMTNTNSFKNMDSWISVLTSKDSEMIKVLIGTKSDLVNERKISTEQGQQLAEKYGMSFFETSAKEDTNILKVFDELVGQMLDNMSKNYIDERDMKASFYLKKKAKTKKCCK